MSTLLQMNHIRRRGTVCSVTCVCVCSYDDSWLAGNYAPPGRPHMMQRGAGRFTRPPVHPAMGRGAAAGYRSAGQADTGMVRTVM